MKYALIIPDGMADYPEPRLNDRTPLEAANTPVLDALARKGRVGLCHTTPPDFPPGSDVCILSLLGFDPARYYTGRAPLEAASLGMPMKPDDLVLRCNLIHTEAGCIRDHSAGHITQAEAKRLIETLERELGSESLHFVSGVSYRNLAVWHGKPGFDCRTVPPHDVPGQPITNNLPEGKDAAFLIELMERAAGILENHPVNQERRLRGLPTADRIWLWGSGYRPDIPAFAIRYGIGGAVISAVGLIRGLARFLDLSVIEVPGITGHFDTDYAAKGRYASGALEDYDLLIVHVEAPDEAGHMGDLDEKIRAMERIDAEILKPLWEKLKSFGEYRIVVSPDHYTPVSKRIHVGEPVPFAACGKGIPAENAVLSEKNAGESGWAFKPGFDLMPWFLKGGVSD